jgi:glycerate-2-kinase
MLTLQDEVFQLTKSPKKVANIINKVIQSADPFQVVQNFFQFNEGLLFFKDKTYDLNHYERIMVLGVGKASIEDK